MSEKISAVVSTKGRTFSTLPACLMSIANQTYKPTELLIYDDNETFKNPTFEPLLKAILDYLMLQGISWRWDPGRKGGQVLNHITSCAQAVNNWIWRLDDDTIAVETCLEKLVANIDDKTGAVGGLVLPQGQFAVSSLASNKIEDIYLGLNQQWFLSSKPAYEVDHLHCSFIYRKDLARYCFDLSTVGHREETLLTYDIKMQGYKIILDPAAKTWHFRNPTGGIRTNSKIEDFNHDEKIFADKLKEWDVKFNDYQFVVLDNGIGDHYAFKYWLPQYFEKHKNKKHIFFVCYPEIFKDYPDIRLGSIAEAHNMFGQNLDKFNIYFFMDTQKWDKSLAWGYKKFLNISGGEIKVEAKLGTGSDIIISPWSQPAKNYPWWPELIKLLKPLGYKLVQIGKNGEQQLDVDLILFDKSFKELETRISNCRTFISVDNLLQHLVNCMPESIKGVVLWGESNPKLFGLPYNLNIVKDEKYFRQDQFDIWQGRIRNDLAFESPDVVFEKIKGLL